MERHSTPPSSLQNQNCRDRPMQAQLVLIRVTAVVR